MKNRIVNIIALSALSIAVIGLMIYSFTVHNDLEEHKTQEAAARDAVFEGLVDSAEKLNAGITKIGISEDTAKMSELLTDIWKNSAEAAVQVDNAALDEEDKRELESFVNVLGDYAHSLEREIMEKGTLDADDREQLTAAAAAMRKVTEQLRYARENGYTTDIDIDAFFEERELEFVSEEYPRMIYDGPFSESTQNRAPRGLKSYDVTEQKALKTAEEFAGCALRPAAHTDGEILPFYNFENEEGSVRVSITKQGGAVLYYKKVCETDGLSILPTEEKVREIERIAREFLRTNGYGDTSASWKSYYDGTAVVEMVPQTEEGILFYPDILKVWVNMTSGEVTGLDTRNYLMNHTERMELPMGSVMTDEEARSKISSQLTVKDSSLAVIPNDDGSESFCRGFLCEDDQKQKYFVFLDAVSGEERDILIVLENNDGQLTM